MHVYCVTYRLARWTWLHTQAYVEWTRFSPSIMSKNCRGICEWYVHVNGDNISTRFDNKPVWLWWTLKINILMNSVPVHLYLVVTAQDYIQGWRWWSMAQLWGCLCWLVWVSYFSWALIAAKCVITRSYVYIRNHTDTHHALRIYIYLLQKEHCFVTLVEKMTAR